MSQENGEMPTVFLDLDTLTRMPTLINALTIALRAMSNMLINAGIYTQEEIEAEIARVHSGAKEYQEKLIKEMIDKPFDPKQYL